MCMNPGRRVPEGLAAVGWRVGVYWRDDQKFYMGEIAAYREEDDEYEITYDDSELSFLACSAVNTLEHRSQRHTKKYHSGTSLDNLWMLSSKATCHKHGQYSLLAIFSWQGTHLHVAAAKHSCQLLQQTLYAYTGACTQDQVQLL